MKPRVIISQDFELRWGVHHMLKTNDQYETNLNNVPEVIKRTLDIFYKKEISCTWAIVGGILLNNWNEFFDRCKKFPEYYELVYELYNKKENRKSNKNFFFNIDCAKEIKSLQKQEVGSHSFCHLFFQNLNMSETIFQNDLEITKLAFQDKLSLTPTSLVFPKNQINYLKNLENSEILKYREVDKGFYYINENNFRLIKKYLRVIDSLNFLKNKNNNITNNKNVPSSMFVRFNLPESLWKIHLYTIKKNIRSLKNNQIFHIWWHPHNLGKNIIENIKRLNQICEYISQNVREGHILSNNMSDC